MDWATLAAAVKPSCPGRRDLVCPQLHRQGFAMGYCDTAGNMFEWMAWTHGRRVFVCIVVMLAGMTV
jgi:hypothetical protein